MSRFPLYLSTHFFRLSWKITHSETNFSLPRSRLPLSGSDWNECFIIQARNYANGSRWPFIRLKLPRGAWSRISRVNSSWFVRVSPGPICRATRRGNQWLSASVDRRYIGGRKRYDGERLIIVRSAVVV